MPFEQDPLDPRSPDPSAVTEHVNAIVREAADPETFSAKVPKLANSVKLVRCLFLLAGVRERTAPRYSTGLPPDWAEPPWSRHQHGAARLAQPLNAARRLAQKPRRF